MTRISSAASLLHTAVQDLHAGKTDAAARLPKLADAATDVELVALLRSEASRAEAQAARLAEVGGDVSGPANLWMRGILDDAERDARTTEPGRLLDIALIGAVRKGKAAEIVSSETAIALARQLDQAPLAEAVAANREKEIATDQALKARLAALTA